MFKKWVCLIGKFPNLLKGNEDLTILGFDLSRVGLGATKREQKTKHVFHVAVLGPRYIGFYGFRDVIATKSTQLARA